MWKTYFKQYLDEKFPLFLQDKPWNYKDDLCVIGAWDLYAAACMMAYSEQLRRA